MKLREHRGSIGDSMVTCVEIEPTLAALVEAIRNSLGDFWHVDQEQVHVEHYGYDARIDWETHIVTIDGYGVYGFTDGPLDDSIEWHKMKQRKLMASRFTNRKPPAVVPAEACFPMTDDRSNGGRP